MGVQAGAGYVFSRNGTNWDEEAQLFASDADEFDWFGASVSINGENLIIGAHNNDDNGSNSGSAYIFKKNKDGWLEVAKLNASDGDSEDYFGWSVSIDKDTAVIGAIGDSDNGGHSGSAYVFKNSGNIWSQEVKLLSSDGEEGDGFGCSVNVAGNYMIIGSYDDDDNGVSSGSAYVFKNDGITWIENEKLLASDGEDGDFFGFSVSFNNEYAVIGAVFGDNNIKQRTGCAYIFKKSNDTQDPVVKIKKPERGLYLFDKKILPRIIRPAKIIGKLTIEADAIDEDSGVDRVEFFINGRLKENDTTEPYTFEWRWNRPRLFHLFIIKIIAYDNSGNTAIDRMIVRKFI
jgi:hypothetical protein